MTCRHRKHVALILKSGARSPGARLCLVCDTALFWCAFCDTLTPATRNSGWQCFENDTALPPVDFPITGNWWRAGYRERSTWLCCPECFAESGSETLPAYLANRYAMHPEPSYVRVYRQRSDFHTVTVEERTR